MFGYRLIIVAVCFIVVSLFIGKLFDNRYRKRWDWLYFSKMDELTKGKTDYNVIFLGDSRTHTGINPFIIDSITGLNSYNFAIGAGDEQEAKMYSTVYLQQHSAPEVVVIGVGHSMVTDYTLLNERYGYLFYLDNDTIAAYIKRNNFHSGLIKNMPFTKYSFFNEYARTSIFIGSGKIVKLFKHNYNKGFVNVFPDLTTDTTNDARYYRPLVQKNDIDPKAAATFQEAVEVLKAGGSNVILLFPPVRRKKTGNQLTFVDSFFLNVSRKYELPVIRMDTVSVFARKYFLDVNHLNEPGSEILSQLVAAYLKDYFIKPKSAAIR